MLLGGKLQCPLIGLGTYKLSSADAVSKALERELRARLCRLIVGREGSNMLQATKTAFPHPCPSSPAGLSAVGYRLIDCAPVYENEEVVGAGLRGFIEQVRCCCCLGAVV